MQEEILFSVLIANFNNGKYIKSAIQSALDQTYQHIEIVVVDDKSRDNSVEIVDGFKSTHSNVKLYRNRANMGCGYTKRRAVALAKGSLMGFLDPDDVLTANAIEIMVKAHNANNMVSLIGSSHYVCDENLRPQREAYGACQIPTNENYLTYCKGITAFASFKRIYYDLTPGINAHFKRAVDQDLYYKLEEVGDLLFIPKILYKYRVHQGGISSFQNIAKSRYWLIRAKESAYNRRLLRNTTKNITLAEIRSWWSILYATKAGVALGKKKYCAVIFWMFKSFLKSPFDRYLILKLKSLFIHAKPKWLDR